MDALSAFFSKMFNLLVPFLESVLPTSPFREYLQGYENGQSGLLSAINYFVPVSTFIAITEVWVTAMFLYYFYHGLIASIWHPQDIGDYHDRNKFFGGLKSIFLKIFKKL